MRFLLDMGLSRRTAEVNRRLEDVLSRFASILEEGALISVTDNAVRVRRLPVGRSAS